MEISVFTRRRSWERELYKRYFSMGAGIYLGVEWEDTTVAFTDHMQEERDSYEGKYMRTTEEATPFEAMLAQVGDKIIEYETEKYSSQRLIAFLTGQQQIRLSGIRL